MIMEYVAGGELFDYIVKHGRVCFSSMLLDLLVNSISHIHLLEYSFTSSVQKYEKQISSGSKCILNVQLLKTMMPYCFNK